MKAMTQRQSKTVLVVDDDRTGRETLAEAVHEMGYDTLVAASGEEALAALQQQSVDLVITDLKMPGMDGLQLLRRLMQLDPKVFVIFITAYATVETARAAYNLGARDYVVKPIDLREMEAVLKRQSDAQDLLLSHEQLKARLDEKFGFDQIIGRSAAIMQVFERVRQVADSESTVLIYGESGTGKELIANAIHHNSSRRDGPFIKVHCAALSESLLESELFGHERGAFTGAVSQRKGRFELADGGTLFLDEVSEIPLTTQVKLLRVLQEYRFERVGGSQTLRVDVRLIAATNADLPQRVKEGRFREDLFYRLNVVPIRVPPLRERMEDVPLLVAHFTRLFAEKNRKNVSGVAPQALAALMARDWPGNVRELQNCVEGMVVTSLSEKLDLDSIPVTHRRPAAAGSTGFALGMSMKQIEERAIRQTLDSVDGNRKLAAEMLGIGLRTLHRKIDEYGIERLRK